MFARVEGRDDSWPVPAPMRVCNEAPVGPSEGCLGGVERRGLAGDGGGGGDCGGERRLSMKGIRRIGLTGMSVQDKGSCGVRGNRGQS